MSKDLQQRGRKNVFTGRVISDKMDKTISVLTYNSVKHPKYKKYLKKTSVFKVHDEKNLAKTGDIVNVFETRALSKTKRWKLMNLARSSKADFTKSDVEGEVYAYEKKKKQAKAEELKEESPVQENKQQNQQEDSNEKEQG